MARYQIVHKGSAFTATDSYASLEDAIEGTKKT